MSKNSDLAIAEGSAIFARIRDILEQARNNVVRSVNTTQVISNWLIGREIVEEQQLGKLRAGYGDKLLDSLAQRLKETYGRGYSARNLRFIRQFYMDYPELLPSNEIRNALRTKSTENHTLTQLTMRNAARTESWQPGLLHSNLSWTHYRTLLRVKRLEARNFYEVEAIANSWTARELERQINSLLFDRLAKSKNSDVMRKLASEGLAPEKPIEMLKDPMVLEFLDLPESPKLVESSLEEALVSNLQTFLLELGKGFAFVSRQERITLDGDHFYIDLVFYHTILKCFVLIDLKVGKLSHGDLGQIQFYVNYYDKERRSEGDNPTIGLVLCPDKNDAVVKYTLGEQQERNIFTSRYQLYLPSEAELKQEIQRELRYFSTDERAGNRS